jgi:hypothetical protein
MLSTDLTQTTWWGRGIQPFPEPVMYLGCASIIDRMPFGAQQRTPRIGELKRSRVSSVVVLQLLDVGLQFLPASQAAEVELNHLQSPLRWLFSGPEADQ